MLIKFIGAHEAIFVEADSFDFSFEHVTTIADAATTMGTDERMHIAAVTDEQAPRRVDTNQVVFRRASFYRPGRRETVLFNTTGYVLNKDGDTIDKLPGLPVQSRWEPGAQGDLTRSYRYCQRCEKTWDEEPDGMSCDGPAVVCPECANTGKAPGGILSPSTP